VYFLLDKVVAPELVTATVRSKVTPYVERHSLRLDNVLLDYLKVISVISVAGRVREVSWFQG
jgi:hypothetical protein